MYISRNPVLSALVALLMFGGSDAIAQKALPVTPAQDIANGPDYQTTAAYVREKLMGLRTDWWGGVPISSVETKGCFFRITEAGENATATREVNLNNTHAIVDITDPTRVYFSDAGGVQDHFEGNISNSYVHGAIVFYTKDVDAAPRLAKALNHLSNFCKVQKAQESDPFK